MNRLIPIFAAGAILISAPAFAGMDTDHDGKVSDAELRAGFKVARPFAPHDKNHDGYITPDELPAMTDKSSPFAVVDANHDGKLSADEYYEGVDDDAGYFSFVCDTNNDGAIDPSEAKCVFGEDVF